MTSIYALADPRTHRIRYVGRSDNPKRRLSSHKAWWTQRTTAKAKWICELAQTRLIPLLIILDQVPAKDGDAQENAWIVGLAPLELLNGTRGRKAKWFTRRRRKK